MMLANLLYQKIIIMEGFMTKTNSSLLKNNKQEVYMIKTNSLQKQQNKNKELFMTKKLLSLLLTGILSLSLVLPASAAENEPSIVPYATNAKTVYTDGGTNGRITISFRATCVLVSYSTKYSWTSSVADFMSCHQTALMSCL